MHMRRGEYMLEEVAKDAWEYGRKFLLQGKVADYIPELGKANPVHFGLCIKTEDGSQQHCNISVKKRSLGM